MGDCLYLRAPDTTSDEPQLLVLPSELWMAPEEVGRVFTERGHFLNTTSGVWFYEGHLLYERAELATRLRKLADLVESPEFDEMYKRARRARLRRARKGQVWGARLRST